MNSLNQVSNVVSTSRFLNSAAAATLDLPPRGSSNEAREYFQRRPKATTDDVKIPAQPGLPIIPRRGSTGEAARILGCSTSLVRWLIQTGQLQHVERPGKRLYLLDLDEVHRFRIKKMAEREES